MLQSHNRKLSYRARGIIEFKVNCGFLDSILKAQQDYLDRSNSDLDAFSYRQKVFERGLRKSTPELLKNAIERSKEYMDKRQRTVAVRVSNGEVLDSFRLARDHLPGNVADESIVAAAVYFIGHQLYNDDDGSSDREGPSRTNPRKFADRSADGDSTGRGSVSGSTSTKGASSVIKSVGHTPRGSDVTITATVISMAEAKALVTGAEALPQGPTIDREEATKTLRALMESTASSMARLKA